MPKKKASAKKSNKKKPRHKSFLEDIFEDMAVAAGVPPQYETSKFPIQLETSYIPDWDFGGSVFVETKGYFSSKNRSSLLAFKRQHPSVEILLMFGNSNNKLSSKSKTTYAMWAEKNGFEWADIRNGIPKSWIKRFKTLKREGKE